MAKKCSARNVNIGDVLLSKTSKYLVQSFVGQGTFGLVAKCRNMTSNKNVAIKIVKNESQLNQQTASEISVLRKLRDLDPEKSNIVRWHEHFTQSGNNCLVFEQLDRSLKDFMEERNWEPLPIKQIRAIVQQGANALGHLNALRLLHCDLKLPNIMLVNHEREPFRIKLIDFGLTYKDSAIQTGCIIQTLSYRCPEVFLGLPLTMAVDIWSLGCVAVELYMGASLFKGKCEYDIMMQIIEMMGLPPDHLLSFGIYTGSYFEKKWKSSVVSVWTVKTAAQYFQETGKTVRDYRNHSIRSLDQLLDVPRHRLSPDYVAEINDVLMFVDMLKWMFTLDCAERISPKELLKHQFIDMRHIVAFYNISPYSQSCYNIMEAIKTPGCTDALPQYSQEACISSAPSNFNVGPSLPPKPAAGAGKAHIRPVGSKYGTALRLPTKPQTEEGLLREKEQKQSVGKMQVKKLQSRSTAPYPEARVPTVADAPPQTLSWDRGKKAFI